MRGRKLVLKADMLVQSTDVPRGMTFRQAARKAVAMCVSDFAAKGTKPDSFMVSLGVSRKASSGQVRELGLGLLDATRAWRVKLVGGDTSEAKQLIINCAMAGFASRYVKRDGAGRGDAIVTTGRFGFPPAGLKILLGRARASKRFRRKAVGAVLMPRPNLRLGLALARYWTASMDSSDGLARTLYTLSRMSGVGIEINALPVGEGVEAFARTNGLSVKDLVFGGGEEYLIVGTMKPSRVRAAARVARAHGGELVKIGTAAGRAGNVVLHAGGKKEPIADAGWVHLR